MKCCENSAYADLSNTVRKVAGCENIAETEVHHPTDEEILNL